MVAENFREKKNNGDAATRTVILERAITLFAGHGFRGVSMRDLAQAVGITPGALYHYFPDKQQLYLAALAQVHARTRPAGVALLNPAEGGDALERLERFIRRLCERYHKDAEFLMLVQRSMMDDVAETREALAEALRKNFVALENFLEELAPGFDSHLLAVSIFGLIAHTYNTRQMRHSFPGNKPEHDRPEVLADHVMKVLTQGILSRG